MDQKTTMPISEKYLITINEASMYFSLGIKRMRRLAEDHLGTLSVYNGNRFMIIRPQFEEFLKKTPILDKQKEEAAVSIEHLRNKDIFTLEETALFYGLSKQKFKRYMDENTNLPFIAYYRKRKIIIRGEFETYMKENPEIKEGLKSGRANVSHKA